jgi:hypothetical protein
MEAPPPAVLEPVLPYTRGRERLRLLLLALLAGAWALPWTDAQMPDGAVQRQAGAVRAGLPGAAALLVLWGLALVVLAGRTRRSLRAGAALVDLALALGTLWLLWRGHAWFPTGAPTHAWLPVFLPLALLSLLDAGLLLLARTSVPEVTVVRGASALFAAGAFGVDGAVAPAAIAAWLAISPLLLLRTRTHAGARRALEALGLVAALVALFAPALNLALADLPPATAGTWVGRLGWTLAACLLALLAAYGTWRPRPAPPPA